VTLDPESLEVQSFATSSDGTINDCCTGCVSGCGIYPTNGTCESASDHGSADGYCPITIQQYDAA
jgi:hypothetical protein